MSQGLCLKDLTVFQGIVGRELNEVAFNYIFLWGLPGWTGQASPSVDTEMWHNYNSAARKKERYRSLAKVFERPGEADVHDKDQSTMGGIVRRAKWLRPML